MRFGSKCKRSAAGSERLQGELRDVPRSAGDANTPAGKNFKVPSFSSDAVLKESDADMLTIAKNGKGKMPAWHDKLSDEQLKDLVGFIRTLQKKP